MQLQIDRVSDVEQGQYGPQSTIHSGNERYYVNSDASEYAGKTVDAEVIEKTGRNGKAFKIAKILKVVPESHANGLTQPWSEWEALAAKAHQLAKVLEPDEIATPSNPESAPLCVDRSRARMSFVATVLIAFSNGKIAMEEEGPVPF